MLFHLSADYIQDFLDEKLGHSERFRHTPQAMCMCEYAQFKNMIPNDISWQHLEKKETMTLNFVLFIS